MFKKLLLIGLFASVVSPSFASPIDDWHTALVNETGTLVRGGAGIDRSRLQPILKAVEASFGNIEEFGSALRALRDSELKYADSLMKKGNGSLSLLLALAYSEKSQNAPSSKEAKAYNNKATSYMNMGCKKYKFEFACQILSTVGK